LATDLLLPRDRENHFMRPLFARRKTILHGFCRCSVRASALPSKEMHRGDAFRNIAAVAARLRNSRKTECGAKPLLTGSMVRAAPFALLMLSACARHHHLPPSASAPPTPATATTRTAPQLSTQIPASETGLASWYGHPYHGRAAANGEIYDMEKLTAAHRTLPFGTWVHVTNLTNAKTVDVRITDRGPFVDGRIIDLSHAAAEAIDMIGPGVAQVRVDLLSAPAITVSTNWFAVQAGAFADKNRAERLRTSLEREYGPAHLVVRPGSPALWRVVVGKEPTEQAAGELARRLRSEVGPAFVVRLDLSSRDESPETAASQQ
jgi:rare lipoprotein A